MPPTWRISVLRLHHQASPCDRPARSDMLRHVLQAANTEYGRLSVLIVPRSRDRHLRWLNIDPVLMDHRACARGDGGGRTKNKHDYREAAAADGTHWSK